MSRVERPGSWKGRKGTIKQHWLTPLIWVEWICEWISYGLGKWAFLQILEYLGQLSIVIAVVFFFLERGDRQKAKHYQAWQVINLAYGKPGEGGRTEALQDLCYDGVSLANIDLENIKIPGVSLKNANLAGAHLLNAGLSRADLSGANLSDANLSRAILKETRLSGADLSGANLDNAKLVVATLHDANLSGAILNKADFSGADLCRANFSHTVLTEINLSVAKFLWEVNFSGAVLNKANLSLRDLRSANFSGADLADANLSGANLRGCDLDSVRNWRTIIIAGANVYGVRNAPDGFVEWAKGHGALSVESLGGWMESLHPSIGVRQEEASKQR